MKHEIRARAGVVLAAGATALLLGGCALPRGGEVPGPRAGCGPAPAQLQAFADAWNRRALAPAYGQGLDMAQAACARDAALALTAKDLGPRVGWKAGLTSKAVQERFRATAPVLGALHRRMLLDDGARVPAIFGGRPVWEADMVLVVKDAGIHDAKTPMEALRHLSAMRPFIELPDLTVEDMQKMDAGVLAAINVGARLGVLGAPVPLSNDPETVEALAKVRIFATDVSGATLAQGEGAAALGNPLNAAMWVADAVKREGRTLKAGDLISVGSFTPLVPPKAGQQVTVRYEGLPGAGVPTVSVRFD